MIHISFWKQRAFTPVGLGGYRSIGHWLWSECKAKNIKDCREADWSIRSSKDASGPFSTVEYLVKPGTEFSDYVAFENPLEGSLILTRRLDYETLRNFKVNKVVSNCSHDVGK